MFVEACSGSRTRPDRHGAFLLDDHQVATHNSRSTSADGSSLSISPALPVYGQPVTFTATASDTSGKGGTPGGIAAFYDGTG
jgi:hypothetical protein